MTAYRQSCLPLRLEVPSPSVLGIEHGREREHGREHGRESGCLVVTRTQDRYRTRYRTRIPQIGTACRTNNTEQSKAARKRSDPPYSYGRWFIWLRGTFPPLLAPDVITPLSEGDHAVWYVTRVTGLLDLSHPINLTECLGAALALRKVPEVPEPHH